MTHIHTDVNYFINDMTHVDNHPGEQDTVTDRQLIHELLKLFHLLLDVLQRCTTNKQQQQLNGKNKTNLNNNNNVC